MNSSYSFTDITMVISHPAVGQYVATGEGIGSVNVAMSNDRSAHDVAADGSTMVSKIRARNGTVTISAQQTSSLHKWLVKWYNYLEFAPTDQWAETSVTIRAPRMGESIVATFVSPQKLPDRPYQAQGQQLTWGLMAADIQQDAL